MEIQRLCEAKKLVQGHKVPALERNDHKISKCESWSNNSTFFWPLFSGCLQIIQWSHIIQVASCSEFHLHFNWRYSVFISNWNGRSQKLFLNIILFSLPLLSFHYLYQLFLNTLCFEGMHNSHGFQIMQYIYYCDRLTRVSKYYPF